ncbi:GDCCVxC domain-containing (seleno)protein [Burkholderia ubonensis]|uniref:GDCCVxC domain-containing (seleno)protein n=1 Tax=Burkholderia ubonensis TaxID=101571 RepID=UPI0039F505DF
MPVDACPFFYECLRCHARLRPRPGDCCVFSSFGSVRCRPRRRTTTVRTSPTMCSKRGSTSGAARSTRR